MRHLLALTLTCLAACAAPGEQRTAVASAAVLPAASSASELSAMSSGSELSATSSVSELSATTSASGKPIASGDPSANASETPTPQAPPALVRDFVLPKDWDTMPRDAFARALDACTGDAATHGASHADATVLHLDDATLTQLARALAGSDELAVRAAVLLARSRDPRGGEALLVRLEQRVPEGARSIAGDVIAADAFRQDAFHHGATARDAAARLEALARGNGAHPVLDVRVACAAASLASGRDGVLPFLLAIAREGTSTAVAKPDWRRIDWNERRMQLLMDRAAAALSARAGIECAYDATAPLATREAELARLTRLLAASPTPPLPAKTSQPGAK